VTINGTKVNALIDTGSEVTTITDTWTKEHLQHKELKQTCISLRAANGEEVPYSGILLVDIELLGKKMC
jgi:predicted aspartyl protease